MPNLVSAEFTKEWVIHVKFRSGYKWSKDYAYRSNQRIMPGTMVVVPTGDFYSIALVTRYSIYVEEKHGKFKLKHIVDVLENATARYKVPDSTNDNTDN